MFLLSCDQWVLSKFQPLKGSWPKCQSGVWHLAHWKCSSPRVQRLDVNCDFATSLPCDPKQVILLCETSLVLCGNRNCGLGQKWHAGCSFQTCAYAGITRGLSTTSSLSLRIFACGDRIVLEMLIVSFHRYTIINTRLISKWFWLHDRLQKYIEICTGTNILTYAPGGDCVLLPVSSPGTRTPVLTHWSFLSHVLLPFNSSASCTYQNPRSFSWVFRQSLLDT